MSKSKVITEDLDRGPDGRLLPRHGMFGTPEYEAWRAMIKRCELTTNASFKRYGAKGISVCSRWRESFKSFYSDVGLRPTDLHSIDRYPNNDGNYEPGNVRWATKIEQQRNRKCVRKIPYQGEILILEEVALKCGVLLSTIKARLHRGWSLERSISTPTDLSRVGRWPR